MAEDLASKYFILHLLFKSVFSRYYWIFYTYRLDLQLSIYKCVLSNIVIHHFSVTVVTIVAVFYKNNTINTQLIIQKCMIKTLGITLDF